MTVLGINHVNITVVPALEAATKHFYGTVLGLEQIPKPAGPRQNIGAWYQIGETQIHLSVEDGPQNELSDRHVCYTVSDLDAAESHFRAAGIEIIPDDQHKPRFFIRDPAGNLIEIARADN